MVPSENAGSDRHVVEAVTRQGGPRRQIDSKPHDSHARQWAEAFECPCAPCNFRTQERVAGWVLGALND